MFRKLANTIQELLNDGTTTEYHCSNCNGLITRTTEQCPHCGVWLSYIRCLSCEYLGHEDEFIEDICPKCGDFVKQRSGCLGFILNFLNRDSRSKIEKQKDRELERLFGINAQLPKEKHGKNRKQ
jgi:RNA polymerase subunit RPABC4/transcription elongation factor Spt4